MLRNNPELLNQKEGRDLMRAALRAVEGSMWEDVLNPAPMTGPERKFWREAERTMDQTWETE